MSNKIDKNIDFTDKGIFSDTIEHDDFEQVDIDYVRPETRSSNQFLDKQNDFGSYVDENNNYIIKHDFYGKYCLRCGVILIKSDLEDICKDCWEIL